MASFPLFLSAFLVLVALAIADPRNKTKTTTTEPESFDTSTPWFSSTEGSVVCPTLENPANGLVQGSCSETLPGSSCYYSCNPGFSIEKNRNFVLTCNDIGQWNGDPVRCEVVTCPPIPPPNNGYARGPCFGNIPIGSVCHVHCSQGYEPRYNSQNSRTATCQDNGNWDKYLSLECMPVDSDQLCGDLFPNATNTSNSVGNCAVFCSGYNSMEYLPGPFNYSVQKPDLADCTPYIFSILARGDGTGVCYSGTCVLENDIKLCKEATTSQIKQIKVESFCELHCFDEHAKLNVVYQDTTTTCFHEEWPFQMGNCDGQGACVGNHADKYGDKY